MKDSRQPEFVYSSVATPRRPTSEFTRPRGSGHFELIKLHEKHAPAARVQRFVIGQQVPVYHLGMTDGMKRLRLSGKARNMHAGVTNMQRLAAAEEVVLFFDSSKLYLREEIAPGFPPTLNPTVSHTRELP